VAGGFLYGITDVKKLVTYYFFEVASIWVPVMYSWGVGMGTQLTTDRRTFAFGSFPVFWFPKSLEVVWAHQVGRTPFQTLGPNPYIPDEYIPQEYIDNPDEFDFFMGKAKRMSYFGQDKILKEMAAEYEKCAGKYEPPKPPPKQAKPKGQPEGITYDDSPVRDLNKPAPTAQPSGFPAPGTTRLQLVALYYETPGSIENSLSLVLRLRETIR